jgi:hypothetical protein
MSIAPIEFGDGAIISLEANRNKPIEAALAFCLLAAIVIALAFQSHWGINTDTAWNITLAEKTLDGQRPNIDFVEINPPMSYLMYAPAVLAARFIGFTPEFVADVFCFAAMGLSLWISGLILLRSRLVSRSEGFRLAFVAALALILLPGRSFSEREHIALIAALPCLAALAATATGRGIEPLLSLIAGLGAGFAMSIKPHFALFFLPCLVYAARRGGWRSLAFQTGPYAAIIFVALYWAAIAAWLPAFFERVAPIVRDIYLPARKPLVALLRDPSFLTWSVLAAVFVGISRKRLREPLLAIPALSSFGAFIAYLVQGKLWPYQAYPAFALMALALGPFVVQWIVEPDETRWRWMRLATAETILGVFAIAGIWLAQGTDRRDLENAVSSVAPRPTLLAISPDIATGQPLARRVNGVWVGSSFGIWMTSLSMRALAKDANDIAATQRLQAYMLLDRERLIADIVDKKPEVILVPDGAWMTWVKSHPDVAATLADYDLRGDADDTSLFVRRR